MVSFQDHDVKEKGKSITIHDKPSVLIICIIFIKIKKQLCSMNKLVHELLTDKMEIPGRTSAACFVSPIPGEGCGWEERAPGSEANPNP